HQDAKTQRVQHAHDQQRADSDQSQENERFLAAAGQHPVIDFQHVEGCRERQDAHRRAERENRAEQAAVCGESFSYRTGLRASAPSPSQRLACSLCLPVVSSSVTSIVRKRAFSSPFAASSWNAATVASCSAFVRLICPPSNSCCAFRISRI